MSRPLRVLHVTASNQRRGAEVFAADLVTALGDATEQLVAHIRTSKDVSVEFGCRTHELGSADTRWPVAAVRLRRILASATPDVVLAHGGEALLCTRAASFGRAPRTVYRRIGESLPRWRTGWRRRWVRRQISWSDRVVCVSEANRTELLEVFGADAARIEVIPNAVSSDRLAFVDPARARAELGLPDGPVVLSLGELRWEKAPLVALDTTAPLLTTGAVAAHVFAGDGPDRDAVIEAARVAGVSGSVRVLGRRRDVGTLLSAADVLLVASVTEGMPAVVIEAGLAALPVVAPAVGGIPEVVVPDETGILVRPGDVEELRAAVDRLAGSVELRRRLGAAARRRCNEEFSMRSVAMRYLQVLQAVASS